MTPAEAVITVQVNGAAVGDPVTDRPDQQMGSTFQVYVGSGNDAEVTLYSISTIPATSRKSSGGSGWFW